MTADHDPALRDELTGLANRRRLRELFAVVWEALLAEHGRVALLLVDLDLFKEVNDRHGHLAGDEVLRVAAQRLHDGFRGGDFLVRYGGDEFVVVLPGLGAEEARALATRVRQTFAEQEWSVPSSGRALGVPISFSIGVAVAPDDGRSGDEVLELADRRLYEEKKARQERRVRRRRLQVAAVVAVVVAAAVALVARRPPSAPQVGAPAAAASPFAEVPAASLAQEKAAAEAREIEALRAEVERLASALSEEREVDVRHLYEERIRELEAALAEARERAERRATPVAGAASSEGVAARGAAGGEHSGAALSAVAPLAPHPPLAVGERRVTAPGAGESAGTSNANPTARAAATSAREAHVPPQLLRHDPPVYPPLARRVGRQGTIEFRVAVDARGRVTAAEPLGPRLGLGLDAAARRAAFSARYQPALREGVAVPGESVLQIRFVLTDG